MSQPSKWTPRQRQTALETLIDAVEGAFSEGGPIDRYSACDVMAKLSAFVMFSAMVADEPEGGYPDDLMIAGIEACSKQLRSELFSLLSLQKKREHLTGAPCGATIH